VHDTTQRCKTFQNTLEKYSGSSYKKFYMKLLRFRSIHFLLFFLFLSSCAVAQSQVKTAEDKTVEGIKYYVSNAGEDTNDGRTSSTAWATLMHAVSMVKPGDVVEVAPGSYAGFLHAPSEGGKSGTERLPITYKAAGPGVKITSGVQNTIPKGTPGGGAVYGIEILDADYIVIDGFEVSGMSRAGVGLIECHHVTIKNCKCISNGRWGIFTSFTDDCIIENNLCANSALEHGIYYSNSAKGAVIRNNICHSNAMNGIHMNGDKFSSPSYRKNIPLTGVIDGALIYGNVLYNNGTKHMGAALNMDGVLNAIIYNNLIYDQHAAGITCYGIDATLPSQNATIYNNTIIIDSEGGRANIHISDHATTGVGATGAKVFNNILINNTTSRAAIEIFPASREGFSSNNNIMTNRLELASGDPSNVTKVQPIGLSQWQSNCYDAKSQAVGDLNSLFVSPEKHDYHLKPNSPAINAGSNIASTIVTSDIEGNARPTGNGLDIGAYEVK
jgi:parallel beta-helix repeat protein